MTFKDKPTRAGAKPFDRDKKPKPDTRAEGGKPFKAAKPRADKASGADDAGSNKPERISKIMARVGVASRRDIERMIMEGRVSLNGKVLDTPVVNATLADHIEVDGVAIRGIERTRLWLYHKPAGLVTTNSDPEGRATVFDNLPESLPRVLSIGRLDINTEGLLLLTNDGGLSRVLELPATGWLRRYRVRAYGEVDQDALDKLKEGIAVDGVLYGGIEATLDRTQGHNVWITMGLREGKNREIKNVLGALGLEVNRLIRISYGPFQLGDLPEGEAIEVRGRTLRDQLGPRLIEESKANFDAPIYGATDVEDDGETAAPDRKADRKPERSAWEKPGDKRERALSRLDTKRDSAKGGDRFEKKERGARSFGGSDAARDPRERPRVPGKSRTVNVWMAPGARPVVDRDGKKKEGGDEAEKRTPRARPEGAPQSKRYGRNKDGKPTKGANRFDPDRKGTRPFDRPDTGPRVVVTRADDDRDWIRAEAPARDESGGRNRGSGDRPERGERSFSGKPRGDRPQRSEGGERSFSPKPRGDRPPRTEDGERPRGRSFGGDKRDDRPREDRPRGERPFGDKPRGGKPGSKPFGAKPAGAKPYSAKPRTERPDGDKPRGGRPSGGAAGVKRGADRRR